MAAKADKKKQSIYGIHPGVIMMRNWVERLPEKTGRSLDDWLALVVKNGPSGLEERSAWLKKEHGFGTNEAAWIAGRAEGKRGEDYDFDEYLAAAEEHVEAMYAGPKAALRPIYERLLRLGLDLGEDTKACPCKTFVPIYRRYVIAQIKPTTRTRIDLGLALARYEGPIPERLIDTGGLARKDRITHRIAVTSLDDIDQELMEWLRVAYELDAE